MSCSKHNTCQLYFPTPRNGKEKDFIIFFYPDNNEQRPVIRCEWFQENYECVKDYGFGWEKLNATHAVITVPTQVAAESGNFISHFQGQDETGSWECSWTPVDSCFPAYPTIRSEPDYSTTPLGTGVLPSKSEYSGNKDYPAVIVGLSVGIGFLLLVILVLVILAIVGIKMFKKLKSAGGDQQSEKMMEKGQKYDTVISGDKKNAIDGYTNKDSGMVPVQLSGEVQNLLSEAPADKKVSDFSFPPCDSRDIPDIRINGHSNEDVDQIKPSHPSAEGWN